MSVSSGSILHLFSKLQHTAPMVEQTTLQLERGRGIAGDVNADPLSPRQVLIVQEQDLLDLSLQPGDLRENIVIHGSDRSFKPGSILEFSNQVAIGLTLYCEPCKTVSHLVKSLKDLAGKRGILGVVVAGGTLTVGDRFVIHPDAFPALPEKPFDRFLNFLTQIPVGQVVTYREVITSIGVANGYFRALPKYLQKADHSGYPAHRVLNTSGEITAHVRDQKQRLEAEGVRVQETGSVLLEDYLWQARWITFHGGHQRDEHQDSTASYSAANT
ncbi:MGMT family protein [Egbenema bharatensis]|uniref:MGMT family protein n=1 Tax=Egbenema bharatensis TaxID=3463334 RepID=UPI003A86E5C0